jgi:hypothetical protein
VKHLYFFFQNHFLFQYLFVRPKSANKRINTETRNDSERRNINVSQAEKGFIEGEHFKGKNNSPV